MGVEIGAIDALAVNFWILRISGAWIFGITSPVRRFMYHIYGNLALVVLSLAYYTTEIVYVNLVWGDLEAIIEVSFLLLTHLGTAVKLVNLLIRRGRIEKLVVDSYQAMFVPRNSEHRKFLGSAVWAANRDNIVFVLMCSCTVMAWAIVPLIEKGERHLPLKTWFPFETKSSPTFEVTYVYQVVALEVNACLNAMMDTFASVLMILAGAQLDILRYDLSNLGQEGGESDGSVVFGGDGVTENVERVVPGVAEDKVKRKLRAGDVDVEFPSYREDIAERRIVGCIEHHGAIVRFAKEIQDVFGIGILVQFVASSTIICLTCFELSQISPTSLKFFSMLLYQACMMFQVYVYCGRGNGIIVKTSELMTAAFHCQWIPCSPRFKTSLGIVMSRMQRPLKLMVGGLFGLSLETFTMILRSAYSFYAVLQRVHTGSE